MEEILILVSSDDRETGAAEKMHIHRQGLLHRAFSIFIFDDGGRLLLQQRAQNKYHSHGLWTNSCCGHPRQGEHTDAAARRRLQEEMGIASNLRKVSTLLYREAVSDELIEHEYDHIYAGLSHTDPIANPDEAASWKWVGISDLSAWIATDPEHFTIWFRRIFETVGSDGIMNWNKEISQYS